MTFDWHWLYFVFGVLFILIEIFTLTFYFLPIGIAAIVTGLFALFIQNVYIHVAIFTIAGIILLIFISKWKKSRFLKPVGTQFVAGLVGQQGVIIEGFMSSQSPGKVKIFSDIWEIHWDPHQESKVMNLKVGDLVKVITVEGNKVTVDKVKT